MIISYHFYQTASLNKEQSNKNVHVLTSK